MAYAIQKVTVLERLWFPRIDFDGYGHKSIMKRKTEKPTTTKIYFVRLGTEPKQKHIKNVLQVNSFY